MRQFKGGGNEIPILGLTYSFCAPDLLQEVLTEACFNILKAETVAGRWSRKPFQTKNRFQIGHFQLLYSDINQRNPTLIKT